MSAEPVAKATTAGTSWGAEARNNVARMATFSDRFDVDATDREASATSENSIDADLTQGLSQRSVVCERRGVHTGFGRRYPG